MQNNLPKACDVASKKNSKGNTSHWIGYKLHIDAADSGIPISCLLTSATSGTIFDSTKLLLSKWFLAMHLMTQLKTAVSALELKR